MRVALANDHGGYPLRKAVIEAIAATGNELVDLGADSIERSDYPDFGKMAGEAILSGKADRAVAICGSGIGICIAANKMKGIYAGLCHDVYSAHQSVEHDNVNVLCMGGQVIGPALAKDIVIAFLNAKPLAEERYLRRIEKYKAIEASQSK
jgi:ribose 5-phosphate isomerase B